MIKPKNDLTGLTFDMLTVLYQTEDYISPSGKRYAMYHCVCNCDNHTEIDVRGCNLQSGNTTNCGCRKTVGIKKYNTYDLSKEYGIGWTTNTNKEFWFDLEDYDLIKNYCWRESPENYICTTIYVNNKPKILFLHCLIMATHYTNKEVVDHKNGQRWDNRKHKMRLCTHCENARNSGLMKNNTSGYTGVGWNKQYNKWFANITVKKKRIFLGYFNDIDDAIKARKEAEVKYFKEFRYQGECNETN